MNQQTPVWDLLGDLDAFGQQWWDKAPLHRSPADFDPTSIISLPDLDRVLASRQTDARLFNQDGHVDPAEHRTQGLRRADERSWLANPSALLDRFRAGSTIMMPTAHETWAPIGALANHLEELLDAQVGATLFVSPPGSLTDWHLDPGHVFVLHLYGTKHWLIEHQRSAEAQVDSPYMVTVRPGDLLYVPEGFMHRVRGAQAPAVHVSFYLSAPSWADLLKGAITHRIEQMSAEELRRSAVNPRWGTACRAEWSATLNTAIDQVDAEIDEMRRALPDLGFDSLAPDRARRPLGLTDQTGAFLAAFHSSATENTRFRLARQLEVDDDSGARGRLRLDGRCVDVPRRWSIAVGRLLRSHRREFTLPELELETEDALALVRRLTAEGVLER